MNEIDVLRVIAQKLSGRKGAAALSNYQVLSRNIHFVNELFRLSLDELKEMRGQVERDLKNDDLLTVAAKDDSKAEYHFRSIIPSMLSNDVGLIEKFIFYTQADDRTEIDIDSLPLSKKGFIDFNNLVTAARQFIDSLVAEAYQLTLLDAKETNFQVLTSLNSFFKYATKSFVNALFSPEIEDALQEFQTLNRKQMVNGAESSITRCAENSFSKKVDFLFSRLNVTNDEFKTRLKDLFGFASESTHVGYVSTYFTGSDIPEVIFTDDIGPYLPSTENFSELKYELLHTAITFYKEIYLPSINLSLEKMFEAPTLDSISRTITERITKISSDLATRNNNYFFPIKAGLIGSDKTIDLTCRCGTTRFWQPPHEMYELYCKDCGSQFGFMELSGEGGYIITGDGPIRIIGSDAPILTEAEKAEIHGQYFGTTQKSEQESWTADRFLKLPEETRLLLGTLSAFRGPCALSTLQSLLPDISRERLEGILEKLESEQLVRHDQDAYSVSDALREIAYSLIREDSK